MKNKTLAGIVAGALALVPVGCGQSPPRQEKAGESYVKEMVPDTDVFLSIRDHRLEAKFTVGKNFYKIVDANLETQRDITVFINEKQQKLSDEEIHAYKGFMIKTLMETFNQEPSFCGTADLIPIKVVPRERYLDK